MTRFKYRLLLDLGMLIGLLMLMDLGFMGILWHERLGIALGIIFLIHFFQHSTWLRTAAKGRRKGMSGQKLNHMFYLSLALGISCLLSAMTGILISRTLPEIALFAGRPGILRLHHGAAYFALLLAGIHLGVHVRALLVLLMAWIPANMHRLVRQLSRAMALLILLGGIRAFILLDYHRVLAGPITGVTPLIQPAPAEFVETEQGQQLINQEPVDPEAVQDYLNGLVCTGCSRRCFLLKPECQIGLRQRREAEALFMEHFSQQNDQNPLGDDSSDKLTDRICTGCSRSCLLTQPECLIGVRQLQKVQELHTGKEIKSGDTGEIVEGDSLTFDGKSVQFPLVMGLFAVGSHYYFGWQDRRRFDK